MKRHNGFTLIELVVVIMILGILASVAAPKLLSVSGDATDNGLKQTLSIVRDAIELYVADHNGNLPTCSTPGTTFKTALAPYIRGEFPVCPVGPAKNANVENTGAGATAGVAEPDNGWKYNTDDGTFICNYDANTVSDSSVGYDDL